MTSPHAKAMSDVGYYAERANEAAAMVAEVERAMSRDPESRELRVNYASAMKFFRRAEDEFKESARLSQKDVLHYRGQSFLQAMVALHAAREAIDAEIAEAERCPLHARAAMLKGAGDEE